MYEKYFHEAFEASLVVKGIHAIIELIGAAVVYLVSSETIVRFATILAGGEFAEDPHGLFVSLFMQAAHHLAVPAKAFFAGYLLVSGLVNLLIVWSLWHEKLHFFPVAIGIIAAVGAYELYRFATGGGWWFLVLALFEVLVIWLVYHEYRYQTHLRTRSNSALEGAA